MTAAENPSSANVLSSATRVLEAMTFICLQTQPVSLAALAAHLECSEVSAYRAAQTLIASGFIRAATGGRSGYLPSWKLVELAAPMLARNELRSFAQPVLRSLADKYDESITLAIPAGSKALFVDRISVNRSIEFYCDIGRRLPLHIGAASRAILAHYPAQLFEQYIAGDLTSMTAATTTSPDLLREDRVSIRAQGYSVSREDVEIGITGVAAPILNRNGEILGAAAIANVSARWDEDDIRERGEAMIRVCAEISTRCDMLTYAPHLGED
ncbi:hypothetical protein ASD65_08565 [Microbacterium sp. Root61]|uniref:IclR family transcriptional regulator n=1 Tax=Microbacterium sp. Root61 TaxID=1736570 RepID=UPI0006F926A5|nr:IclR family transcriptional regulator [Microbacterium sp. Root61]KRA24468.1 hypothetical protein ASD65_08565 [Microbacterium sp. Root61]